MEGRLLKFGFPAEDWKNFGAPTTFSENQHANNQPETKPAIGRFLSIPYADVFNSSFI
jgi:hypothetical protein